MLKAGSGWLIRAIPALYNTEYFILDGLYIYNASNIVCCCIIIIIIIVNIVI